MDHPTGHPAAKLRSRSAGGLVAIPMTLALQVREKELEVGGLDGGEVQRKLNASSHLAYVICLWL